MLYGFPPGYGATGTAALLNVPASLLALLRALVAEGYHVGPLPESGEELIARVKEADEAWVSRLPPGERLEDTTTTTVAVDTSPPVVTATSPTRRRCRTLRSCSSTWPPSITTC